MSAAIALMSDLQEFVGYVRTVRASYTALTYGKLLRQILSRLPAGASWSDLSPADWERALLAAYGERKRATLNAAVSALRTFLRWAHDTGRLSTLDALRRLRRARQERRLPRYLSEAQERAFVEWVFAEPVRFRAACLLMLRGGLRRSEVRTFVAERWERGILWGRVIGKGNVERVVAVIPVSERERRLLSRFVRIGEVSFPYSPGTLTKLLCELGKRLGFQLSPHRLRHTYATRLLEWGISLDVIQQLLGHASVTTTQVYAVTTASRVRAALSALAVGGARNRRSLAVNV